MHKLLQTQDAVFLSYVEAMLKAEGILCERVPIIGIYNFGGSILYVDEQDSWRAEAVLRAARAEAEAGGGAEPS